MFDFLLTEDGDYLLLETSDKILLDSQSIAPTLTTDTANNIASNIASLNGTISETGGENSTTRGFEYGTTPSPDRVVSEDGSFSAGAFQLDIGGLIPGQQYFFRAFATNSLGTGYGEWKSFVALPSEYSVTINGIDRTADIINKTLVISDELNDKQNTCEFQMRDLSGFGIPDTESEIIITMPDGDRLFGGYIIKVQTAKAGEVYASISCIDYVRLFDSNLVNRGYTGMTDKAIIQDIVARYCPGFGITTNNVIQGVTIDQINFNYVQPSQALRRIADLTGRNWYIDYYKDIHYFPLLTNTSPFNIEDTPAPVTTTFIDEDMQTTPSGVLKGVAAYVSPSYVLLTGPWDSQYGQIEYSKALPSSFIADFDFTIGFGGVPPLAADAIWFYFGCSITPNNEDQIESYDGYLIIYDEYNDEIQLSFDGTRLASVAQTGLDNEALRNGKVVIDGTNIKIYLDSVLKLEYNDIPRTLGGTRLGLGARTGAYVNEHRINRFRVYSVAENNTATDYKGLVITKDGSQLKNRVYVRGGTQLSDFTNYQEKGDGIKTQFVLPDKPHDVTIEVDRGSGFVEETVGIKNVDTENFDWYLNFQEKYIEQDAGGAILDNTDTVKITYKYDIPILVAVENGDSIQEFGQKEFPIFDRSISTQQEARDRATAELTDYAAHIIEGSFRTFTNGFRSGQYITINLAAYGVNANYIIKRVVAHSFGGGKFYYEISLASAKTMGIIRFLIELLEANNKLVQVSDDEVVDNLLAVADALLGDSLQDNLTIDSAGPYATWSTDSLQSSPSTRARWDLFQWG